MNNEFIKLKKMYYKEGEPTKEVDIIYRASLIQSAQPNGNLGKLVLRGVDNRNCTLVKLNNGHAVFCNTPVVEIYKKLQGIMP